MTSVEYTSVDCALTNFIIRSAHLRCRILMCFMCGDGFSVELPLAPLLNHQFCFVTSDEYATMTLETYLDESKRKVEVTATSYHGASQFKDCLYHGYVLVYSARRKASLASLKYVLLHITVNLCLCL